MGRLVIYWLSAVAFFGIGIAVTQYCDYPNWTFAEHVRAWLSKAGPWIPSMVLLLPLVLYDMIRTSHAFTGPINRVRLQLAKLSQNPNCTPLVLRQDDYLHDIIAPVNGLQHQILSLHMALQKQRDLIEELRAMKSTTTDSTDTPPEVQDSRRSNVAQIAKEDLDTAQLMESITSAS